MGENVACMGERGERCSELWTDKLKRRDNLEGLVVKVTINKKYK
jgi:hypothetical protein